MILLTLSDGGQMTLFNSHKVALLFAGLALTANTWASESLSDVTKPSLEQGENVTTRDDKASLYRDYDKMAQDNQDQLAAIHKELRRILSQNYYDFPEQAAQVTELLNQLNAAKKAELEAQAASDKGDWESANAAAKKWEQAQAQAAESVSNTQMALKLKGAKQVIALKATEPMVNPFTVVSDGKTESLETTAAAVEPTLPITPVEEIQLDGATLYNEKGCVSCHGVDGKMPVKANYPQLAGQVPEYALAQMKDIKNDARTNRESVVMKGLVQVVSDDDLNTIAQWLASVPMEINSDVSMETSGAQLYQSKGCLACHGADAKTPLPNYPKLAGLNEAYTIAQMTDIKSGARDNGQSMAMKAIMQSVSDEDIQRIGQWLASLAKAIEPPSETAAVESLETTAPAVEPTFPITPVEEIQLHGATLYNEKGCVSCHGSEGKMPIMLLYPKLAGQNQDYALVQLKDIKSGARDNGQSIIMKGIMQGVNEEEMTLIAQWLTSLPQEHGVATDATLADQGAKLYNDKTCVACHGKDAQTPIMPIYPKLAGQNPDYVIAQMKDIKSGARHNGLTVVMKGVMQMISDEEIEAIAQWLVSPTEIKKK